MKTQILAFFGLMASTATFATDLVKCDKYFSAGYEQTWVSDDTLSGTYGALDVQFQFTDEMYRTYLGNSSGGRDFHWTRENSAKFSTRNQQFSKKKKKAGIQ